MGSFVQQTTWGWMIAAYLFLGGLGGAVGAIGIGIDLYLEPHRRMGIFAALSGFVFLAVGTLLLMLDLLQPLKVVFFFLNPSSWIFWGILSCPTSRPGRWWTALPPISPSSTVGSGGRAWLPYSWALA